MARIVITEFMDEQAVQTLRTKHEVLYSPSLVDDQTALLSELGTADAVIVRNRTQVRGDVLAALQQCRVLGRLGVGLDNIDVPACEARGIQVIPASGANALSVAEYVIGTSMLLLRQAYWSSDKVAAGLWPRQALSSGREINGKTLGIVGFGVIGQLTARLSSALGMNVIAFHPRLDPNHDAYREGRVSAVGLDELCSQADIVSLHVPLSASTQGLFDAQRIDSLKAGAILINTARGGIVDELALAQALKAGRLGGAALDVFTEEPLKHAEHFKDCPNLILTPHIAGVTSEANERVSAMIAEKVLAALG